MFTVAFVQEQLLLLQETIVGRVNALKSNILSLLAQNIP